MRDWSVNTVKFTGDEDGNVKQLHAVRVGPPPKFEPMPGTEFTLDADLVLLAMGFLGPVKNGMIEQLGVELDARGNVAADENYMSSRPRRLRRRRHAPRPVAGGLGHRRRPQGRRRHRSVPERLRDRAPAYPLSLPLTPQQCTLRWFSAPESLLHPLRCPLDAFEWLRE